jgi:predicted aspartyl protease
MKQLLWAALVLAAAVARSQALVPPSAPAALVSPAPAVADAPVAPLAEVLVSAPEPRYVAPTRRDRIGRIWAPVYLNGQGPFRLVLDTGANRSAVIASVADALGERARTNSTVRLRGVTGTAVVPAIRVDRMEIGDLLLEPVLLPVAPDVFGGAEGVLGNEGLRDKRIVIDFKHDSITVKRSRRERPGNGFQTLPITMMATHLLVVDVRIGGVSAKAIIDTGAADSLGNLALLEALKKREADEPGTEIVGVTLDVEYGNRVHMPTILIQGVRIRGAVMTFGDVDIFKHWRMTREPTILLGMDVLGSVEQLIIDYKSRELHILTGSS